jgi:hypothetical protein
MAFKARMDKLADELRSKLLANVATPSPNIAFPGENEFAMKRRLSLNYFDTIKTANLVLICNWKKNGIEGYIGINTLAEIAIGIYHNRRVCCIEQYPKEYADEFKAWGVGIWDATFLEKLPRMFG